MFKKLLFLFIIFILIISCRRATTRPNMSNLGTPPSEEGIPEIPDITPPDNEEDYYIKANDTEETIKNKIQKYYEKLGMYIALIDDTEDNIEKNGTIEKINNIINNDIYSQGVFLDLSKTDMTKIADDSFVENKHLFSVKLPETIISIGISAFSNAKALSAINFPSMLNEIGKGAFYGCINLKEVNLEYAQIKTISDQSFDSCSKLVKVTLPNMLLAINEKAFNNCESLTEINFPVTLEDIGRGAFLKCKSLQEANLKDTKITILSNYIFSDCSSLSKVELPDVLLGMENSAFSYCISLEEINFPDSFTVIGNAVFYGCSSLKNVKFNDKIKSIYHYAFYGCTSLSKISLPSSLSKLGATGAEVFTECPSLSDVEYLGQVPNAIIYPGNVFGTSKPQNLYLPNVDDPATSDPPQDPNTWINFLGYDWTGKIKYKQSMPNE